MTTTDLQTHGPALRPGDDGFDAECAGFQTAHPHRPDLAVGAATAADVVTAIRYAGANGLPYAVTATGHGLVAPLDGGVLITTRRMRGVSVDPAAGTARIRAGACWADVVAAATPHGLAPVSGSAPGVGVVGYLLGGGFGLLGRRYGYASDRVTAFEVVTPDGTAERVGAGDARFAGLRGGGAGELVVTAVETGLVPLAEVWGGALAFDLAEVPDVLDAFRDWAATLPDDVTPSVAALAFPDLPVFPPHLRGRHVAQVRVVATRPADDLVAPLRRLGPALADDLRTMPFADSHTIVADPTEPHAYSGDAVLVRDLPADALPAIAAAAGPGAAAPSIVEVRRLGGAMAVPPPEPDAVVHRDAGYLLRVVTPLDGTDARTARRVQASAFAVVDGQVLGPARTFRYGA
ncbi:MAG: FAD-binding protein [Pseudonocardia sp.]|nr:FAD-binding protein [Pseudonocardia sp.]